MALLHYLSYVGAAAAFIFVTLSLASGLLWLSELIEEHARHAKTIGQRGIYVIIFLHIVLYLYDSLPLKHILFSIACHVVYLQNFTSSWPYISLSSTNFIASCLLVVTDHFVWFFHFAHITTEARRRAKSVYRGPRATEDVPGFADIATFFGICVWLAPLFLFLSLSANDNALPVNLGGKSSVLNTPVDVASPIMTRPRGSLFKSLYDSIPRIRRPRRRDSSQGIIAPSSPNIRPVSSPLPSPNLLRIQSINSPPPSSAPPSRRGSTDSPASPGMLGADTRDIFQSPKALSSFQLSPPPRRGLGAYPRTPTRRSITGEGRLELRRVVSSNAASERDIDL